MIDPEMCEELESACEEPCQYCGGVHVSIEQMDALGFSELRVLRCNGELTVSALDILERIEKTSL